MSNKYIIPMRTAKVSHWKKNKHVVSVREKRSSEEKTSNPLWLLLHGMYAVSNSEVEHDNER